MTLSNRSQPLLGLICSPLALARPSGTDLDEEASQTFGSDGQESLPVLLCKSGLCFVSCLVLVGVLEPSVGGELSGYFARFHCVSPCLIRGGDHENGRGFV